jgi:hypothetical protein
MLEEDILSLVLIKKEKAAEVPEEMMQFLSPETKEILTKIEKYFII